MLRGKDDTDDHEDIDVPVRRMTCRKPKPNTMISNFLMKKLILLSLAVFLSGLLHAQTFDEPFWNQQLPVDVRVRDLYSILT